MSGEIYPQDLVLENLIVTDSPSSSVLATESLLHLFGLRADLFPVEQFMGDVDIPKNGGFSTHAPDVNVELAPPHVVALIFTLIKQK